MKTMIRPVALCFCIAACTALAACSGGMSDAQVQQELKKFFGEIDQAYAAAGGLPDSGVLKWTIDLETAQLQVVDKYLAANTYPAEVQQHLTDMKNGLTKRIATYQSWIDNGLTRDTAPAGEVTAADDAAIQSTSAETQLRILAGL